MYFLLQRERVSRQTMTLLRVGGSVEHPQRGARCADIQSDPHPLPRLSLGDIPVQVEYLYSPLIVYRPDEMDSSLGERQTLSV